jgi:hypothetical protein
LKASVTVDTSKLDSAITKAMKKTGVDLSTAIKEASVLFLQSAARQTPPDAGKQRFSKRTNERPITPLKNPQGKTRYKVPYRTHKKRGKKYFDSLAEAKSFSKIKWRGIGRAGWWGSLPVLGKTVAGQPGTEDVKRSISRWSFGSFIKELFSATFIVTNKAPTINESFARIISNIAIGKASARLNSALKKINKNLEGGFK